MTTSTRWKEQQQQQQRRKLGEKGTTVSSPRLQPTRCADVVA
jgi:hypothetical protein